MFTSGVINIVEISLGKEEGREPVSADKALNNVGSLVGGLALGVMAAPTPKAFASRSNESNNGASFDSLRREIWGVCICMGIFKIVQRLCVQFEKGAGV